MAELADLTVRQDAFENALRVAVTEVQLLKGKVEGNDLTPGNVDYRLAELGRSVDFKLDLLAKASSQRKALDSDSRLAVKAQPFSGRHEDWRDFAFLFKSYIGAHNSRTKQLMDDIATTMKPRLNTTIAPEDAARSEELYYVLATNLKNPSAALKKIQSVKEGEGFAAWRRFLLEYVNRCSGELTGRNGSGDRSRINNRAPCRVHQVRAVR